MTDKYDVIVVGGGHNGLVAAAYLAKAGLGVLVLEGREVLGGAASTEEPFPGFKIDTGAGDAGLLFPEVVAEFALAQKGLAFLEGEALAFAPQPDGSALTLWRDMAKSKEEIEKFSAADAGKFEDYLSELASMGKMLREVLLRTPPDLGNLSLGQALPWMQTGLKLRRQTKPNMMALIRALPMPARDFLDEWFESDALKGVLGASSISGGMPGPYEAGTAFMLLYQSIGMNGNSFRSSQFVQGGMGHLAAVLADVARDNGAEIRTGARVTRIRLDSNEEQALGVRLRSGEEIEAQMIVSNADPRNTFFNLVGGAHLEPQFMREVKNIRYKGVTAKVNLALSGLPEFKGAAGEKAMSGHILISPNLEYLERAWDDAKYGRVSGKPFLDATIPTILDPSLAPAGKHVMSITMQYAPYHLSGGNWEREREALGDKIIGTLAEYAPNLPKLILDRQTITPLDWESEYGLSEGQSYHGQMGLDQLIIMRPIARYARYRTPFKGLYLCGAGTHPGGGVTGGPGYLAAREIIKDWKKGS